MVCRSHGSPLRRRSRSLAGSPSVSPSVSYDGCSLKAKKALDRKYQLDYRLNRTELSMVSVINSRFFIDYCSGRCNRYRTEHNLKLIKGKYAQQMSRGCQDNEVDCMELMPCCLPKTYHGKSSPTRIEFKTILVKYVNELNYEEQYYHTFLEPRICHCQ